MYTGEVTMPGRRLCHGGVDPTSRELIQDVDARPTLLTPAQDI